MKEPIHEKVKQLDCEFIGLETMPAHVLYLTGRTRQWRQRNRPETEGFASKILRQWFRHFTTSLQTLWTRSYFGSKHKHLSSQTIEKYIAEWKKV